MLKCEQDGKEADKGSKGIFHHNFIIFAEGDKSNGNMIIMVLKVLMFKKYWNRLRGYVIMRAFLNIKMEPRSNLINYLMKLLRAQL